MSKGFVLAALATASLCLCVATSSADDAGKDPNARVVSVSVHDGAHANRRLTLALNKATVVQLGARLAAFSSWRRRPARRTRFSSTPPAIRSFRWISGSRRTPATSAR